MKLLMVCTEASYRELFYLSKMETLNGNTVKLSCIMKLDKLDLNSLVGQFRKELSKADMVVIFNEDKIIQDNMSKISSILDRRKNLKRYYLYQKCEQDCVHLFNSKCVHITSCKYFDRYRIIDTKGVLGNTYPLCSDYCEEDK